MVYETLGKISVTLLIMVGVFILWLIVMIIFDIINEYIENRPQWIKTIIGIGGLLTITVFIGYLIFNSL